MAQTRYRLGVLFVHGMGGQQSGGTLHQFGDPLYEWFDRWNPSGDTPNGPRAALSEVHLGRSGEAPAHATLTLAAADGEQHWLLAESHWADEFRPPPFGRLMLWLVVLAPWITCEYMRAVWARAITRGQDSTRRANARLYLVRAVALLATSVVGPVLCGVLVVFLLALRVLSLVPNVQLRKRVDSVVRALVNSLGDVFTIVESPLDREAILTRIGRDLRWLEENKVQNLVVVAHSAGAALTYRYLTTNPDVRPDLYVTVGQAIWRMRWVEAIRDRSVVRAVVGLGSLALVGGVVGLVGRTANASWALSHAGSSWLVLALAGLNLSGWLTAHVWADVDDTLRTTIVEEGIKATNRWNDYVASSDPVPAGRLAQPGRAPGGRFLVGLAAAATVVAGIVGVLLRLIGAEFGTDAHPHLWPGVVTAGVLLATVSLGTLDPPKKTEGFTVTNRFTSDLIRSHRTMFTDHVTYPRNVEGFVTPLACSLAGVAGLPVSVPALDHARQRRRKRTAALVLGRFAYLATALWLAVALAATDRFVHVGRWLRGVWEWLFTGKHHPIEGKGWLAHQRLGMVAVGLGLAVGFAVIATLWSAWDRAESARLFKGETMSAPSPRWNTAYWVARAALPTTLGLLSLPGARGCWLVFGCFAVGVGVGGGLPAKVVWRRDRDLPANPPADGGGTAQAVAAS